MDYSPLFFRSYYRELKWDIVKDKDASMVWLDKWEMTDLTNLRHFKVSTIFTDTLSFRATVLYRLNV